MTEKIAPVKEGEIHVVEIFKLGHKGDGIARIDGFTIFVPDTTVGQKVKVKITSVRATFGFAEKLIQAPE